MGFAVVLTMAGGAPLAARTAAQAEAITFNTTPIAWEACPETPVAGLECAIYEVPLDDREPGGETVELALRRMLAASEHRVGTLFFNPGGPGGTGTGQSVEWLGQFAAPVRERFDLVSWDPRGVGELTGVQCFQNAEAEGAALGQIGAFPLTYAEQEAFAAAWQQVADVCAETQSDLLAHVSTADTARDLE